MAIKPKSTQMFIQKFKRVQISKSVFLKSGLEEVVYNCLNKNKCTFVYEGIKINFTSPEQKRTYTPDFPVSHSNIIIETKGQFNSADRKKMRLIKEQNPKYDIRFIFSNSKTKIGKKSKTTYGRWCEMFGFKYHCVQSTKKEVPENWLQEIKEKQNGTTRN